MKYGAGSILSLGIRVLYIDMNNHQKFTFHQLGNFLNPALVLLGLNLKNHQFSKN